MPVLRNTDREIIYLNYNILKKAQNAFYRRGLNSRENGSVAVQIMLTKKIIIKFSV